MWDLCIKIGMAANRHCTVIDGSLNTLPLYGTLLGSLFLGETVGPAHLIGGAMIVGGGLCAARTPADD